MDEIPEITLDSGKLGGPFMAHLDGMWSGGADVPQRKGDASDAWRAPMAFK